MAFRSLALSIFAQLGSSTVVRLPTLPYEAHSVNDLDAWPALLSAGVRYIKLDVGVCDRASCANRALSTFGRGDLPGDRGNASRDCFSDGGKDYCCLCLRGDASTRPTLFDPFNTSFDLVQFLRAAPPAVSGNNAYSDASSSCCSACSSGWVWRSCSAR